MIETRQLDNSQTRYTYDAENQLISFSKPGVTATYAYDGLGRRIQKSVNGTLTRYIYDNEGILLDDVGAGVYANLVLQMILRFTS